MVFAHCTILQSTKYPTSWIVQAYSFAFLSVKSIDSFVYIRYFGVQNIILQYSVLGLQRKIYENTKANLVDVLKMLMNLIE